MEKVFFNWEAFGPVLDQGLPPWFTLRVLASFGLARIDLRPHNSPADEIPPETRMAWGAAPADLVELAACGTVDDVWCWCSRRLRRPMPIWLG